MAHETPAELVADIQAQLEHEWVRFRNRSHNPSNKGDSYEEELKNLLERYFSGVYELISQPVFIDPELKVFDEFDTGRGEHELDVVGLFRQAKPRIVFELSEMTYVPLEGIAFICEVKSQIDKDRLKHDLQKLEKVECLCDFKSEMVTGRSTERYATTPPVKCLIYDQDTISSESLEELIERYPGCWDMILIVESEQLIVNADLPVLDPILSPQSHADMIGSQLEDLPDEAVEFFENMSKGSKQQRKEDGYVYMGNALINFLILLSLLVPSPISVHTTNTLESLNHEYVLSKNS